MIHLWVWHIIGLQPFSSLCKCYWLKALADACIHKGIVFCEHGPVKIVQSDIKLVGPPLRIHIALHHADQQRIHKRCGQWCGMVH